MVIMADNLLHRLVGQPRNEKQAAGQEAGQEGQEGQEGHGRAAGAPLLASFGMNASSVRGSVLLLEQRWRPILPTLPTSCVMRVKIATSS